MIINALGALVYFAIAILAARAAVNFHKDQSRLK